MIRCREFCSSSKACSVQRMCPSACAHPQVKQMQSHTVHLLACMLEQGFCRPGIGQNLNRERESVCYICCSHLGLIR